jgi:hypothetical protein
VVDVGDDAEVADVIELHGGAAGDEYGWQPSNILPGAALMWPACGSRPPVRPISVSTHERRRAARDAPHERSARG